ncbi:MAG: TolC family protein [Nitrospirae bacterium]|jgi:outer membrane protein|nr:TolC family protein [Nitrospirota bacterium]
MNVTVIYNMRFKVMIYALIAFIFSAGVVAPENLFAEEYSLEDMYRIALERAERIKISEEDLYIAEREKEKAVSVLFPRLSAFWDYTKFSEEKSATFAERFITLQPDYSTSWGLKLDQSMSLSGREITALKISKENIKRSEYDLYAVTEEYLLSVASAYYDILRAKRAFEIAKANAERLTKHRDAATTRLKVGEVTKTDLLRAEAELSGAKSDMVRAENSLKLAKAILARIAGLTGDYEIKEPGVTEPLEGYVLPYLKEKALSERAELKSMNLQKKIAEDQVKYTKGAYWPDISIEGAYVGRDEDPASPFFLKEAIYGKLMLNFPFFEGGLRRAEVNEAKARQRQAGLSYEDLIKTINIEVENAYLEFQTQKMVIKSIEDEVTFARDNYNAVSKQYEFGLANSIDVIDANTLLLTSERQLSDAGYFYQLSILRLKRVTGTLLKTVMSE